MRTAGGFDVRGGSVEAVAVAAREVASSSPSKNNSALDVMSRYQRISPDRLPLANGSGSGSSACRKLPALAPRPSADVHDAPADSSRPPSYLATASLEQHKPRARVPHPPPASSSAAAVVIRNLVHQHPDLTDNTAPNPIGGSSGEGSVRLQWGYRKRSRGRRDSSPLLPTPAPAQETPAQARRSTSIKIGRPAASAQAAAEKLMPPPSGRGGPSFRAASFLPPRAASAAAADALHGRTVVHQHQRSAEEPRSGAVAEQQQPAVRPPAEKQHQQQQNRPYRQPSEKEKGKAPAVPESPKPTELQKLVAAARPELPRIVTQLTRKEKEDDFLAMKGTKLPVRPKKRTKAVEKAVSMICPGQWLADVSRTRYMVREKRSRKDKRKGGLKAMDSDSD